MSDGPRTLRDWVDYLHSAAQALKDKPSDTEARDAVAFARERIGHLNRISNVVEAAEPPERASEVASALGEAAHHMSLGAGEPIAGLGSAIEGKGFRAGAQRYREGLENLEESNPRTAAYSGLGGDAMLAALSFAAGPLKGMQAIKPGVPIGLGAGTKLVSQGALAGAIPGAIAGFSAGGDDPGDIGTRVRKARNDALLGAVLGAASTGVGMRLARGHVERAADITNAGNQRALTGSRLAESEARLARLKPPAPPDPAAEAEAQRALEAEMGATRPDVEPAHPDAVAAVRDAAAGKIRGADVRDALDFAAGRPFVPEGPTGPISQGAPGSAQRAMEAPTLGRDPVRAPPGMAQQEAVDLATREQRATAETMARPQRGLTRAQYAHRGKLFGSAIGRVPTEQVTPDVMASIKSDNAVQLMQRLASARGAERAAIEAELSARRAALGGQ